MKWNVPSITIKPIKMQTIMWIGYLEGRDYQMDIKGLRNLNQVGISLFLFIGFLLAGSQWYQMSRYQRVLPEEDYSGCFTLIMIWMIILVVFSVLLYKYTVLELDKGNYTTAKSWTIVGIIVGFAGGIIPLIIFIVSYVSFDDAVRTAKYGPMPPAIPPFPTPVRYCIECKRLIPPDSRICPYCGVSQGGMDPGRKNVRQLKLKTEPGLKQDGKPLPPPPKSHKKEEDP
jgi:heme/copper-type cytochrome/quinol oxidase subunit 2